MIITNDWQVHGFTFQGCASCGHPQIIVSDERIKNSFKAGMLDVFLCQDEKGKCSSCGLEVDLPVPEMLDPERSEKGRALIEIGKQRRQEWDDQAYYEELDKLKKQELENPSEVNDEEAR